MTRKIKYIKLNCDCRDMENATYYKIIIGKTKKDYKMYDIFIMKWKNEKVLVKVIDYINNLNIKILIVDII